MADRNGAGIAGNVDDDGLLDESIRRRAEEIMKSRPSRTVPPASPADFLKLIHELELRQVELEIQNEELRMAQSLGVNERDRYKQYSSLFETGLTGILISHPDGRILAANPEACRILGRSEQEICLGGRESVVNMADPRFLAALDERAKTGMFRGELTFIRGDNVVFPVEIASSQFRDAAGNLYSNLFFQDITEQKLTENALRESEIKFRTIIDLSPVPMALIDKESNITLVNPAFGITYGYTLEELGGIYNWYKLAFPDPAYRRWVMTSWKSMLSRARRESKPYAPLEITVRCKNSSEKIVLASVTSYPGSTEGGYLIVMYDITGRKKTEEELREKEEKLRTSYHYARNLIEVSLDPLVTINVDGKITDVNTATEKATGRSRAFLIGTDFSDYFTDPEKARRGYQQGFDLGEVYDYQLTLRHVSGSTMDVLYNASVYHDIEGKILGVFAAARDITKRKHAENTLRIMFESLEDLVVERNIELATLTRELTFHKNEIEQFTYISTHDLLEPLQGLANFTNLLHEEYEGKLDVTGNKSLEIIQSSANRMKMLLKGLLDYSLIGKEGIKTEVDCNELVAVIIDDLEDMIRKSDASIIVHELPVIKCYRTEMRLLVYNLLTNALKYCRNDIAPEIVMSAQSRSGEWVFSVKDNGIGIEEKDHQKIFIIFKRLHNRSEYSGVGIGLAHCRKIVELHGGKIWVESGPGPGSNFIFTIPKK
jgi:PAS domain S-box-containing protein